MKPHKISHPKPLKGATFTYYDITLGQNISQGSDILEKPCSVVFTYPDGSRSSTYTGTIIAWPTSNTVRISSSYLNIEDAWTGANGGTLTITTTTTLSYPITGFSKND